MQIAEIVSNSDLPDLPPYRPLKGINIMCLVNIIFLLLLCERNSEKVWNLGYTRTTNVAVSHPVRCDYMLSLGVKSGQIYETDSGQLRDIQSCLVTGNFLPTPPQKYVISLNARLIGFSCVCMQYSQ